VVVTIGAIRRAKKRGRKTGTFNTNRLYSAIGVSGHETERVYSFNPGVCMWRGEGRKGKNGRGRGERRGRGQCPLQILDPPLTATSCTGYESLDGLSNSDVM